jgi:nitroreductase
MFIDLLRKRRSVRSFQDTPVEQEKIDLLIEAMLRAPSSRNLNPWEFVVVTGKDTLDALSKARPHGASFVKNAPLAIVVCADPAKCDVWVEDCSIAAILLHLAATDLGLGSCWAQMRLREYDAQQSAGCRVAEILSLEEGMEVEAIIAIGYSAMETEGHVTSSLPFDHVSYERFGNRDGE